MDIKWIFIVSSVVFPIMASSGDAGDEASLESVSTSSISWMSGITDSTGVSNTGSAYLKWNAGSWGSCDAPSRSCGTSNGNENRTVTCYAQHLNGTVSQETDSDCISVASTIGSKPDETRACSRNFGACTSTSTPTSTPTSSTPAKKIIKKYTGTIAYKQADACWSVCNWPVSSKESRDCRAQNLDYMIGRVKGLYDTKDYSVTLPATLTGPNGRTKVYYGIYQISHTAAQSCPPGYKEDSYKMSSTKNDTRVGNCNRGVLAIGTRATTRTCSK